MLNDVIKGIKDYFRAFALMNKLKLWKYVFFTGILSILFGGGLVLGMMGMIQAFAGTIKALYPFEAGKEYIVTIAQFISAAATIVLGLMIYKYIVFIVFVPFLGPMSEKVEEYLTGRKTGYPAWNLVRLAKDVWRGLLISLRLLYKELIWLVVLFILGFIPLISPFVPALAFLVDAFYGGYGNFDWALERYYNVRQRIEFIRYNKGLTLGNGIPFVLLLSIPVLGFFLAPALSVVAATISVVERIEGKG